MEVEADPAAAEIVRLAQRAAVDDRAGIAEGDAVVIPAFRRCLDDLDCFFRSHGRAGRNFGGFLLAFYAHFDVSAADIDDEDLSARRERRWIWFAFCRAYVYARKYISSSCYFGERHEKCVAFHVLTGKRCRRGNVHLGGAVGVRSIVGE